jgi:polyphenol oxidase
MLPEPFTADDHGQIAVELPGAHAVFTTRRGGRSRGPYASLNLGLLTDDDPVAVTANRRWLKRTYGVELAWGRQVHGSVIEDRTGGNVTEGPDGATESDGQVTGSRGVAPMVLTADCLGIVIATRDAVGAVHAGWRGLAGGVIAHGVARIRALSDSAPMVAAIGPGAGPCCYEVGEEVHAEFAACGDRVRSGRNLDLKAIATKQLHAAGVGTVHDVGLCTICGDPELFFSHRRDRGVTGRQAAIAWLS